jgi:PTH1 family peptidyl-tRNA hydrolase
MYLVVGLGNPGKEYEYTRHNAGFLVADKIAESTGSAFRPGKGEYWLAHCSFNNCEVTVMKPVTYMNSSGIAVNEFVEQQQIALKDILIVCDDFQLALGTLRLRQNGTDGGHHGLESVIYHLQSDQFARLRCGIASVAMPVEKSMMKEFVLEKFEKSELQLVNQMVGRARDACISFVVDGIDSAMNRLNAKPFENNLI